MELRSYCINKFGRVQQLTLIVNSKVELMLNFQHGHGRGRQHAENIIRSSHELPIQCFYDPIYITIQYIKLVNI